MDIKILKDEKKPMLKRREVSGTLGYSNKTPSRSDIIKEVAKVLKAKEEMIIVNQILPDYGTQTAKIRITVYDDKETMKALEGKGMLKKHNVKTESAEKNDSESVESEEKKE